MEKIEDFEFEFEGYGLTQTQKGKTKHSQPLFMVYFNKAGTAKGKFSHAAVTALKLKPEAVGKDEPIAYKTVNIASTNKGKLIYTFNSTTTGEANKSKKTLSPNYIIDLSAKEWKMLYDANGLTEKEDCYFSMTAKKVPLLDEIFILQASDIQVEKTIRTDEQKKHSEELSTSLKKEHAEFVQFAKTNAIDFKGEENYMAKFQVWATNKALAKKVKAVK